MNYVSEKLSHQYLAVEDCLLCGLLHSLVL